MGLSFSNVLQIKIWKLRCEAIGAENASLAEIIEAAEGKAAERDALVEQKDELDIQKTELQSK